MHEHAPAVFAISYTARCSTHLPLYHIFRYPCTFATARAHFAERDARHSRKPARSWTTRTSASSVYTGPRPYAAVENPTIRRVGIAGILAPQAQSILQRSLPPIRRLDEPVDRAPAGRCAGDRRGGPPWPPAAERRDARVHPENRVTRADSSGDGLSEVPSGTSYVFSRPIHWVAHCAQVCLASWSFQQSWDAPRCNSLQTRDEKCAILCMVITQLPTLIARIDPTRPNRATRPDTQAKEVMK